MHLNTLYLLPVHILIFRVSLSEFRVLRVYLSQNPYYIVLQQPVHLFVCSARLCSGKLLFLFISISCMCLKKVDTQEMATDNMSGPASWVLLPNLFYYLPTIFHFLCFSLRSLPLWLSSSSRGLMVTLMQIFLLVDRIDSVTFNSRVLNFPLRLPISTGGLSC